MLYGSMIYDQQSTLRGTLKEFTVSKLVEEKENKRDTRNQDPQITVVNMQIVVHI